MRILLIYILIAVYNLLNIYNFNNLKEYSVVENKKVNKKDTQIVKKKSKVIIN